MMAWTCARSTVRYGHWAAVLAVVFMAPAVADPASLGPTKRLSAAAKHSTDQGRVRRVPILNLNDIVQTPTPGQFALSPDGSHAAFTSFVGGRYFGHPTVTNGGEATNIRMVSLSTGETTLLTGGPFPKTNPTFSPTGEALLFESEGDVWRIDVRTGLSVRLTTHQAPDRHAAWSPDGNRIAFVSSRPGWSGPREPLPISGSGARIWVMSDKGDNEDLMQVTVDPIGASDLTWSLSGDRLLFVGSGDHYFSRQIFVVPSAGGVPRRLTPDDDSWNTLPRWSPDDSQIAFISDRSGYRSLWIMQADGSNARQVMALEQDQDYNHSVYLQSKGIFWSPDGTRVLCFAIRDGNIDAYIADVSGGRAQRVSGPDGLYHPVGWVDNDSIAYVYENYHTPPDLYVKRAASEARQITYSRRAVYQKEHFARQERVTLEASDGLTLHGFLHLPRDLREGERLPGLVFLHTYCPGQNYNEWDPFFSYMVESGYILLRLDHRGSSGYGREFLEAAVGEHGGKVVEDVLDAARFLKRHANVDSERLGVIGYSYGGSLVNFALMKGPELFRAGVSVFGTVDRRGQRRRSWEYYLGGREEDVPLAYIEASPITYVERLKAPVMLIGGMEDTIVDTTQTYRYVHALRKAQKDFELVMYPGEQHGLREPAHQLDSYRRIMTFLDRHVR